MTESSDRSGRSSSIRWGCGGILAIITVLSVLVWSFSDDAPGEGEARVVCENFVSDRLKAPGSAEFNRPEITPDRDGQWVVRGSVDADNAFGATMRVDYTCTVRDTGDGETMTLVDLDMNQR